jgi:mRNA interferase RelE/StbE
LTEFRIFETDEFRRSLRKLDAAHRPRVESALRRRVYPQLRKQPFVGPNIKKLRGYEPETWRYHLGQFRVFYGIDPQQRIVHILTVENRKDAYR